MHRLFFRIFVLFWIAMALIVGGSIAITVMVAMHDYESPELPHRPNLAIEASEVLAKGGERALRAWLKVNKDVINDRDMYIVGPDGKDILGRRLSPPAVRRMEMVTRNSSEGADSRDWNRPPSNFRPQRFAPQIVSPQGTLFTVLLVPRRPSIFGVLSLPGILLAIVLIALAVSAFASWWLARHISAPIRRIQEGARALATDRLDAGPGELRVSAGLEDRKDEVAVLAREFDAMAEQLRANRSAITQLLRDISHELRSPLARMRVALGLARQPGDPERQLLRLEREIERLDKLISQVLKLARLHGTEPAFEREEVDLDEVIDDVVRDANFEGAVKGCKIALEGVAGAKLRGNRELLASAIENVLRNAVRYSPDDTPVDVSVLPRHTSAALAIIVRDRGPGVPAAELQRIFEPFYRVARSRDRDSGGEGIGLAITSQVMRTHGGAARAANRPGGGLEVCLTLPRAPLAA